MRARVHLQFLLQSAKDDVKPAYQSINSCDRVVRESLPSKGLHCYLELSTKLLFTRELSTRYTEPSLKGGLHHVPSSKGRGTKNLKTRVLCLV